MAKSEKQKARRKLKQKTLRFASVQKQRREVARVKEVQARMREKSRPEALAAQSTLQSVGILPPPPRRSPSSQAARLFLHDANEETVEPSLADSVSPLKDVGENLQRGGGLETVPLQTGEEQKDVQTIKAYPSCVPVRDYNYLMSSDERVGILPLPSGKIELIGES